MTNQTPEPNQPEDAEVLPIRQFLEGGVPEVDENEAAERKRRTRIADLSSEVGGLAVDREELAEAIKRHPSEQGLRRAMQENTETSLEAQADLYDAQQQDENR